MRGGFVDTNILVYGATGAQDEPVKWNRALDLLSAGPHCISGQVLAEFFNIAVRKHGLAFADVKKWFEFLERYQFQPVDRAIVADGAAISQRYQISYWDAALVAAAKRMDVTTLYSEDLNHGQTYDGVRLINPFLEH